MLGFGRALTALTAAPPVGFVSVGIRLLWRIFETRFERFKCVKGAKSQLPSPLITPRRMPLRLLPERQTPAAEATHSPSSKSD